MFPVDPLRFKVGDCVFFERLELINLACSSCLCCDVRFFNIDSLLLLTVGVLPLIRTTLFLDTDDCMLLCFSYDWYFLKADSLTTLVILEFCGADMWAIAELNELLSAEAIPFF